MDEIEPLSRDQRGWRIEDGKTNFSHTKETKVTKEDNLQGWRVGDGKTRGILRSRNFAKNAEFFGIILRRQGAENSRFQLPAALKPASFSAQNMGRISLIKDEDSGKVRLKPVEISSAMKQGPPGKSGRPGFTLIELLVVIAIIGILAALLLPTLVRTKRRAQAGSCLNNVKQLNLALLLYAGDYNDWFPANDFRGASWVESMDPGFVGANVEPGIDIGWTNIAFLLDPQYARLGPYTKQASVFKCPSDYKNPWIDPAGRPFPVVRSYAINCAISSQIGEFAAVDPHYALATGDPYTHSTTNWLTYGKLSDITAPSPSDLFTFIDESEYSVCSPDFIVSMNPHPTGWWFFWPSTRHNFAGTLAFADGHGEIHRWLDGRSGTPPLTKWSEDQRTRTLPSLVSQTPDNPDILWLQQHTTAPTP